MTQNTGQDQNLFSDISTPLLSGLSTLWQAKRYANEVQRDAWDFAVEINHLQQLGLSNNDFRWLVCKGLVQHAQEITEPTQNKRLFTDSGELNFTEKTCFILTEIGLAFLNQNQLPVNNTTQVLSEHLATRNDSANGRSILQPHFSPMIKMPQKIRPVWDADLHELRVGDMLVKRFKLPSRNQETILTAFEEEDWPVRIDDPLSLEPDLDPKRRLHDTIKSLNRHQKNKLLRFMGDGTGEGIRWKHIPDDPDNSR